MLGRETFVLKPPVGWYVTHQLSDTRSRYVVSRATARGSDAEYFTIDVDRGPRTPEPRAPRGARTVALRVGTRSIRFTQFQGPTSREWVYRVRGEGFSETWTLSGVGDPERSILKVILASARFSAR